MDVWDFAPADQAINGGGALVELAQFKPGELPYLPEQCRERINPLLFRQSIEIALGLLVDFQRRPENDDGVLRAGS